jgi:hypothetical protein
MGQLLVWSIKKVWTYFSHVHFHKSVSERKIEPSYLDNRNNFMKYHFQRGIYMDQAGDLELIDLSTT